jgi:flagellar biogenesis protein FliO
MALLGALAIIVLMLVGAWYATRWYVRRMGGSFGMGKYIKVIDRAPMGAASLAIVEINGTYYLMGLSERNVQLVCELKDFAESPLQAPKAVSFGQIFSELLEKTRKNYKAKPGNHHNEGYDRQDRGDGGDV